MTARTRKETWKPKRDRRELVKAIFVAVGIVAVTVVVIWILAPKDDDASGTPTSISLPSTPAPTDSTPAPTESTTAPTETTPAPADTTAPGEATTPSG